MFRLTKLNANFQIFILNISWKKTQSHFCLLEQDFRFESLFYTLQPKISDTKGNCVRVHHFLLLKVHKIEIFFGFDFEICIISLLVMSKY